MRVNVYAEEMTDRVEIIAKTIDGHNFTGLRLYLELPATGPDGTQHQGPFMHRPGDDDSAAVTFWGKRDLRVVLQNEGTDTSERAPDETGDTVKRKEAPHDSRRDMSPDVLDVPRAASGLPIAHPSWVAVTVDRLRNVRPKQEDEE